MCRFILPLDFKGHICIKSTVLSIQESKINQNKPSYSPKVVSCEVLLQSVTIWEERNVASFPLTVLEIESLYREVVFVGINRSLSALTEWNCYFSDIVTKGGPMVIPEWIKTLKIAWQSRKRNKWNSSRVLQLNIS